MEPNPDPRSRDGGRRNRAAPARGGRPSPGRASAVRVWAATAVLLGCLVAAEAGPVRAQEEEGGEENPVGLAVDAGTGVLRVSLGPVLEDGGLRRALHSGLPLRIRVQVELWKDRFFDSQRGRADWRATVVYDPLDRTYRVETSSDRSLRVVSSLEEAGEALSLSFDVPLRPREEGSYYYLGQLEVETLSLSDLEELQRWLRGDLAPAVAGDDEVENAVERGMRRLVVRVLGLPARRYRVRTPTFEIGGG